MLTVIYDEDCGVCGASVEWLRARDRRGALRFAGNLGALPEGVSPEETQETVVVLEEGGRKLVRARAASRLLREAGPGWWLLGQLMRAPGISWIADVAYRAFAARRHRISAALGMKACGLRRRPAPAQSPADSKVSAAAGPASPVSTRS